MASSLQAPSLANRRHDNSYRAEWDGNPEIGQRNPWTGVCRTVRVGATPASPWLPFDPPRPDARVRLFCLPYAGGAASAFRGWDRVLDPLIDVCPVQLPGRETRWSEPPFTDMQTMVNALVDALSPFMEMPFALFGHSLGGTVAFEMARALERLGRAGPVHLFASGARAPHGPSQRPPLHNLPSAEFVAGLERLDTIPREVLANRELVELILPTLRADFRVFETYRFSPGSQVRCPLSVFGGHDDHLVTSEELAAWADLATSRVTIRTFPGGHFFVRDARDEVLSAVGQDLERHLIDGKGVERGAR